MLRFLVSLARVALPLLLHPSTLLLAADAVPAGPVAAGTAITPLDNYEQWKSALDTGRGVTPPTFEITPGFVIDTVRVAQPGEDSWIALAFDRRGRAIVAREKRGLLRLTLAEPSVQVEVIDETLEEVRGLLDTPRGLYANANVSRGLYFLADTDRDDRYDEVRPLVKTKSGGHGRNALALAPDGAIAMIHGDSVDLPAGVRRLTSPTVPRLLPGDDLPHGHFLRTDPDGGAWTLVTAGLRNPVGIDFNEDGEAFTYDADAEMDMGMPWYRPTHIRHLVSGADFGWRRVTGRWPPYYVDHIDNPPTTLIIGKGSPTAVKFGRGSHFPPAYRRALFVMDWAYGRILAVHLTPEGAGYTGRAETFLRGRPLNVTGMDFGPDGAMYFVTGGRSTQSALYRVRYVGAPVAAGSETVVDRTRRETAAQARAVRRELEAFHGRQDPAAIAAAWPRLDDADPWIAHAARVALEHQPSADWAQRALAEASVARALPALLALTRVAPDHVLAPVLERLAGLRSEDLPPSGARVWVRIASYAVQRLGRVEAPLRDALIARIDPWVPAKQSALNWEACRLLVELQAPTAVEKVSALLAAAVTQEEKLHYLHVLGGARTGWTDATRARFFRVLAQTGPFKGGAGLPRFLREIRNDALATVPETERPRYAALLDAAPKPVVNAPAATTTPRSFVKAWTMADLEPALHEVRGTRNLARGRQVFAEAQCFACHRMGEEGGAVGPDLTDVASRFSTRDVLEAILEPSRVVADSYRQVTVRTKDGKTITGRPAPVDYRLPVLRIASDPLASETAVDVSKDEIVSYAESDISPMPAALLATFTREEILDMLAFLERGGG